MTGSEEIAAAALALSALTAAGSAFGYVLNRRDIRKQIALQERQVVGEERARDAVSRANLHVTSGSITGGDVNAVYSLSIFNGGPAVAVDARAWAASASGEAITSPLPLGPIAPQADKPTTFEMSLNRAIAGSSDRPWVRVAWTDAAGPHEENLLELPRFP